MDYHDHEWGTPLHDDQRLFEFLVLEGMQAGLSWITILRKREAFRHAFAGFDPARVARFTEKEVARLMQNASIVRNRLKIEAAIGNARAFLALQEKHGSFAVWSWRFVDGAPVVNHWRTPAEVPVYTPAAAAFSKELKKAGFKFVGPTVVYSHMQATGMVNDHLVDCFRHRELA